MVVSETNIHSIPFIRPMWLCYSYSIMNGTDGLIKQPFARFLLYVIYCYTTAGIAWLPQQHKKMLEQTENVAYNTIQILVCHLTTKHQWKPKRYSYKINVSSIPLCISYYAGNDDKGNANITYGLSCTWQAPNRTTAGRTSLLCEVWERYLHGWKLVRLVLMCKVYKNAFQKWLQACKLFVIPHKMVEDAKVFRPQFQQVSVG